MPLSDSGGGGGGAAAEPGDMATAIREAVAAAIAAAAAGIDKSMNPTALPPRVPSPRMPSPRMSSPCDADAAPLSSHASPSGGAAACSLPPLKGAFHGAVAFPPTPGREPSALSTSPNSTLGGSRARSAILVSGEQGGSLLAMAAAERASPPGAARTPQALAPHPPPSASSAAAHHSPLLTRSSQQQRDEHDRQRGHEAGQARSIGSSEPGCDPAGAQQHHHNQPQPEADVAAPTPRRSLMRQFHSLTVREPSDAGTWETRASEPGVPEHMQQQQQQAWGDRATSTSAGNGGAGPSIAEAAEHGYMEDGEPVFMKIHHSPERRLRTRTSVTGTSASPGPRRQGSAGQLAANPMALRQSSSLKNSASAAAAAAAAVAAVSASATASPTPTARLNTRASLRDGSLLSVSPRPPSGAGLSPSGPPSKHASPWGRRPSEPGHHHAAAARGGGARGDHGHALHSHTSVSVSASHAGAIGGRSAAPAWHDEELEEEIRDIRQRFLLPEVPSVSKPAMPGLSSHGHMPAHGELSTFPLPPPHLTKRGINAVSDEDIATALKEYARRMVANASHHGREPLRAVLRQTSMPGSRGLQSSPSIRASHEAAAAAAVAAVAAAEGGGGPGGYKRPDSAASVHRTLRSEGGWSPTQPVLGRPSAT